MKLVARVAALVLGLMVVWTGSASAHPLGNFTVNHYAGLDISADRLAIDYVLDLAEIPTFQFRDTIAPEPVAACSVIAHDLVVTLDGAPVMVSAATGSVSFRPGQAGLDTLRLECAFGAPWNLGASPHDLTFADGSYPDRIGWREITARAEGMAIDTRLPESTVTGRLMTYPQDAFASSPDARTGEVRIAAGVPSTRRPVSTGAPLASTLSPDCSVVSTSPRCPRCLRSPSRSLLARCTPRRPGMAKRSWPRISSARGGRYVTRLPSASLSRSRTRPAY